MHKENSARTAIVILQSKTQDPSGRANTSMERIRRSSGVRQVPHGHPWLCLVPLQLQVVPHRLLGSEGLGLEP